MIVTVTGSTGTIGAELVRLLSSRQLPTRAVLRDTTRIRALPHVAWMQADLRDVDVLEPALAGTTRLFLLTGNDAGFAKTQIQIIEAATHLNVEHVVKLSALGASDHSKSAIAREHWDVEQALQRSGLRWTILRPHAFMQNWLGDVAESVRAEAVIYSPIGDGRVPFIDARDIAEVAFEALVNPEAHADRKYFLTGGEAVGMADLTQVISEATGTAVAYQAISMDEARSRMQARGISPEMIEATIAIAAYQKAGGATATVSDKVARILGRPPRSIRDFVRDYASHFTSAQTP
jgi:uncharacterized protein YbjT (DUF2867 family)